MPGGEAVVRTRRRGDARWVAWPLALALHVALLLAVYRLRPAEIVIPTVDRIIPVTLIPPAPRPPPPPPQTPPEPRRANPDAGGRGGAGTQRPTLPVRQPEHARAVPEPLVIPPVTNPQPDAPVLVGGAGQGEISGDGAADAPGPGAGAGDGRGDGRGPGSGPGGPRGAGGGWRPQWRRLPTMEESGRHYPPAARAAGIEGQAVIRCTVGTTGRVYNCVAVAERPAGHGFGQAAVAMAQYLRISPKRENGRRVEAELLIPLNMGLEGTAVTPLRAPRDGAVRNAPAPRR